MSQNAETDIALAQRPEQQMVERARRAADRFAGVSGDTARAVARAMAEAGAAKARFHAEWIVRETGYGVVEDKVFKNENGSIGYHNFYRDMNFTDPVVDDARKIVRIPRPAGIILGLVPVTNPVSTLHAKAQMAVLTRSSVILCPHPAAMGVCADAAATIIEAARKAGAPEHLIQILPKPNIALVQAFMKSPDIDVILATGGPAMVRAAYGSGNPALGVGPGNVPVFVDDSVDIVGAVGDIVASKGFDNSLGCTSEQVILVENQNMAQVLDALSGANCFVLQDPDDVAKLRGFCYPDGKMNAQVIGKSAAWIAGQAGIQVPQGTRLICVRISRIAHEEEFSREKLFPVIGLMGVQDFEAGLAAAQAMIIMGGAGHSAAIHTTDSYRIARWGSVLKVYRVSVCAPNTMAVGAGTVTSLPPTFTIGTGYFGRSSVGENVTPQHLVHWTQIAYRKDSATPMTGIHEAIRTVADEIADTAGSDLSAGGRTNGSGDGDLSRSQLKEILRELLLEELGNALKGKPPR